MVDSYSKHRDKDGVETYFRLRKYDDGKPSLTNVEASEYYSSSIGLIDKEAMETLFIGRQTSEMTNEVNYLRSGNTFVQIVFNCGRITTLETHDFIYYASPIGKADLIKQRMEQNDNI